MTESERGQKPVEKKHAKMAGKVTEYAWNKFKDFNGWLAGERGNKDALKKTKASISAAVNDSKKLQSSPPETLAGLFRPS